MVDTTSYPKQTLSNFWNAKLPMQGVAMLLVTIALMQSTVEPMLNYLLAVDTQSEIITVLWTGPFNKVSARWQVICHEWA